MTDQSKLFYVFYNKLELCDALSIEQKGIIFDALCKYVKGEKVSFSEPMTGCIYDLIVREHERLDEKLAKRREQVRASRERRAEEQKVQSAQQAQPPSQTATPPAPHISTRTEPRT